MILNRTTEHSYTSSRLVKSPLAPLFQREEAKKALFSQRGHAKRWGICVRNCTNLAWSDLDPRPAQCDGTRRQSRLFFLCLWLSLTIPLLVCPSTFAHAEAQRSLTAEAVGSLLREYVTRQGLWQPNQVEIAVHSIPPITLPPGPVKLQVLKPRAGITPGIQSFLVGAEGRERPGKTGWARADVQIFDNVMVSARPLSYRESITPEAVRLERRDISTLFMRPFTKMEDLASHQAARAIPANVILTPTMVQMPQVIHPGHLVTLVYDTGRLRVEAQGQALDAGKIGEIVRVKNLSSGEILRGQVVNSRSVSIAR